MRPLLIALAIAAAVGASVAGGVGASVAGGVGSSVAGGAAPAAPAPARGTLVATPRFVPEAGPVLAGADRVAWISRRDERVLDLWVAEIGRPPRRVQRYAGADGERLRAARLIASPAALGLELTVLEDGRGRQASVRRYAGPFGQPLAPAEVLPIDGADGPAAQRVVVLGHDRELLRHTDVAPGRAVWVARGCRSAEIRATALPAPAPLTARTPACRLRLRRRATVHADHLRLGVSCAGFRVDCDARVTVRGAGRMLARGRARYNRSTPPYAAADLALTPAGVRLLRAHGRARVQISARIGATGLIRRTWQTIGG